MDTLPLELVVFVASLLPKQDALCVFQTCKQYSSLDFIKAVIQTRYPSIKILDTNENQLEKIRKSL